MACRRRTWSYPRRRRQRHVYDDVAHKCQPLSKDRAHHTDTTTTPQPHHTTFLWCGCGDNVVCPVFGRRLALVGDHTRCSLRLSLEA